MTRKGKRRVATALVALAAGTVLIAGTSAASPCKGEAVSAGATMDEVAKKCGEPMLKEKRRVSVTEAEGKVVRNLVTDIEEWTYSAGATELMQSFRFNDGQVVETSSPGYGPVNDFSIDNCRNGETLAVGDTILDAFMKCGEPLAREKKGEKVTVTEEGKVKRTVRVSVVEWTYRYGQDRPGYTLRFEDGVVAKITPREFGK